MRVMIEGPRWAGMWSEVTADALSRLGHEVALHYHNRKTAAGSLSNRLARFTRRVPGLPTLGTAHAQASNAALVGHMIEGGWDLLISIQGKIEPAVLDGLRRRNPGLRVLFWWGDILTPHGAARVAALHPHVDRLYVSYRGDFRALRAQGLARVRYLPFGVSPRYHCVAERPARERARLAGAVSLVGTWYPERCELVRALRARVRAPLRVWGRSWRRCPGARAGRALALEEAQRVHAHSCVALNLHHLDTCDGLNMKYYEIPAAGGFQIVDRQPLLADGEADRGVVTFAELDELVDQIRYFLAHEDERRERAAAVRARMLAEDTYEVRFRALLDELS